MQFEHRSNYLTKNNVMFKSAPFGVAITLQKIMLCSNLRRLVQVTLKSGLNSDFSWFDCIFDSISVILCDLKVVCLHVFVSDRQMLV